MLLIKAIIVVSVFRTYCQRAPSTAQSKSATQAKIHSKITTKDPSTTKPNPDQIQTRPGNSDSKNPNAECKSRNSTIAKAKEKYNLNN